MKLRTRRLPEFVEWFDEQDAKGQAQIDARILKVEAERYFGDAKDLGEGLAELRWKNGQSKDIRQARLLLRRYAGA